MHMFDFPLIPEKWKFVVVDDDGTLVPVDETGSIHLKFHQKDDGHMPIFCVRQTDVSVAG